MPSLLAIAGPKHGSEAGLATGNIAAGTGDNRYWDAVATPHVVDPLSDGDYWLELSGTSVARNVAWTAAGVLGSGKTHVVLAFRLRFPTSLPPGDLPLAGLQSNSTHDGALIYRTSGTKLVVQIDGTNDVGSFTVAADTDYWVELHVDFTGATSTLDWSVDGTAQTQATVTQTTTAFGVVIGWESASTGTVRFQDILLSSTAANYPLGEHKVVLLSVDPAGTVTVNGSAATFSTFSSNGTINSTFDATTARDAVAEVPPTIGASAAGFVQDANSTTDNVQCPMTSYTLGAGETISGLRMAAVGWAVSTTAATIGFRSWNGTTETTLFAAADPNFDNSTTTPAWVCKMCTLADFDTQSELDALEFRVGFSGDAAPDIGIHAIYAELAVALPAGTALVVASAAHAQTAGSLALTQVHGLTVAGATQAQTAGNVALTQVHELAVADAAHTQTADNLTLTTGAGATNLVIANATHAHTAGSLSLTQAHALVVASAAHAQTAGSLALTQVHELAVANAAHAQAAGTLTLTQVHSLAVSGAAHAHTVGNVDLSGAAVLVVASAAHAHTAGGLSLTQTHVLAVAAATHTQAAGQLVLTQLHLLAIDAAAHTQTADNVAVSTIPPPRWVEGAAGITGMVEAAGGVSGQVEAVGAVAGIIEGAASL